MKYSSTNTNITNMSRTNYLNPCNWVYQTLDEFNMISPKKNISMDRMNIHTVKMQNEMDILDVSEKQRSGNCYVTCVQIKLR